LEFGTGDSAVFVHGSFGWGLDTFPDQRALADHFHVVLMDRAGYGDSPPQEVIGWPTDVDNVIELLTEYNGAHLVGQSYGAVVSLLAAGRRPDLVHSLVAIEPPLYSIAADQPDVRAALTSERRLREAAQEMTTAEFVRAWGSEVMGRDPAAIEEWTESWTPKDWAAAETTRQERWPGDAPLQIAALARLTVPKLVVVGGWPADLFPGRQAAGSAFRAVAETIANRINARLVVFERSAHNPQAEEPALFNELLRDTWTDGSEGGRAHDSGSEI
jgi:pimeloyl-ACP methyl ester carboxylesterase